MTRRTDNLQLLDHELVEINPQDALVLGITDGALVEVTSRHGSIRLAAEVTNAVLPGELFMAFHFPEAPANQLTSAVVDEVTGCPEYKLTAVMICPAVPSESVGA